MYRVYFRVIVSALVMCIGSLAFGQADDAVALEAELSRGRAYVGDVVSYQVVVRGANDGTPPVVDFPKGVRAEYRGASSRKFTTMRSVNGKQRTVTDAYFSHQYALTVVNEGEILIPAAVLSQGSKRYQSNEVQMTALLPAGSAEDFIEIELPSRPVYVGESVVVQVSWWIGGNTQDLSFESSVFPDSMRVTAVTPSGRSGEQVDLTLGGQRFVGYLETGRYQGQTMRRLVFDLVVTPSQAGEEEFGPVRAVFTRLDDSGRRERRFAQAEAVAMRVVGVPGKGKPDGYRGLIGAFSILADASNTSVNVGDPIELRALVRGVEPMMGLKETLEGQGLAAAGFRVSADGWREVERNRSGERLFTTTIRATDASVDEIPAITLPAFNPASGEFEVFASVPIPLDVRSVRTVTLSDAVIAGGLDESGGNLERDELVRNPSVLWTHPDAETIKGSGRVFSLGRVLRDPAWISVLVVIVGMPVVAFGFGIFRRTRDPRAVEIERAWKKAKRLHDRGDDVGAIRVYGGAVLGVEPGSVTGADLTRLGVSEEIVRRSASVLTESEGMAYGSMSGGGSDGSLLREMRRDIRRHQAGRAGRQERRISR